MITIYHTTLETNNTVIYNENSCNKEIVKYLREYFQDKKEKPFPIIENQMKQIEDSSYKLIASIKPKTVILLSGTLLILADFKKYMAFSIIQTER